MTQITANDIKRVVGPDVLAFKDFGDAMYAAVVPMYVNDQIIYGCIDVAARATCLETICNS
jgi:hypothetical protein